MHHNGRMVSVVTGIVFTGSPLMWIKKSARNSIFRILIKLQKVNISIIVTHFFPVTTSPSFCISN